MEKHGYLKRPWGYRTAIRGVSYWRDNRDGTITAKVLMTVWAEGEVWTMETEPDYELWTVQLPLEPGDVTRKGPWWKPWRHYWLAPGPVYMLRDKPHRITWWDEDHPKRKVLSKAPYPKEGS
jgi:hypothetical protein